MSKTLEPQGGGKSDAHELLFEGKFLQKVTDQNTGFACLKLLVMILNAHSSALDINTKRKLNLEDRNHLINQLKVDKELIANLLQFREENVTNRKMHDLLTHICKLIYKLDN